jgi:hypothetical protein
VTIAPPRPSRKRGAPIHIVNEADLREAMQSDSPTSMPYPYRWQLGARPRVSDHPSSVVRCRSYDPGAMVVKRPAAMASDQPRGGVRRLTSA